METETNEAFKLSPQQEQLWRAQQGDSATRAVCVAALTGTLSEPVLEEAVRKVIGRHEILRTLYPKKAGLKLALQRVEDELEPSWERVDLRSIARGERGDPQARIDEIFASELRAPFDAERGPVLRVVLAKLTDDEHLLFLGLPGLAADDAALVRLLEEIAHFYGGGDEEALGDEPLQYADYAAWQEDMLAADDEDATRARSFFREASATAAPSFPFASPFESFELASLAFGLEESTARALPEDAASFLFAAFGILLSRMSGQEQIVLSFIADGRSQDEARTALGLYARAIPLTLSISPEASVKELCERAAAQIAEASLFQYYTAGAASAGVAFELESTFAPQSHAGLLFTLLRKQSVSSPFAVKLGCRLGDGSPCLTLYYDRHVHAPRRIEGLARSFALLLAAMVASPEAHALRLPLVTDEERALFASWNETAVEFRSDARLDQLFDEQVERTPTRIALVSGQERLSYRELSERATLLANALRARGIGKGSTVGLCVSRSAAMMVGVLGIWKAGAAYVPLLPEHPAQRLLQQCAIVETRAIVSEESLLSGLPEFGVPVVCLDRRDDLAVEAPPAENANPPSSSDLAYVIFTSGSTGVPKGVAVTHKNLVNYTEALKKRLELDAHPEGLSFATVSTLAADLGNTCLFPALVSGGVLHIMPSNVAMDGRLYADYAKEHPIDILKITPSHLRALLLQDKGVLPRRTLITGGEACSWELADLVLSQGSCALINHYGPTETTIGSLTYGPVQKDDPARSFSATVPIGKPIANTRIHLLDELGMPVPLGAPGELHIGGAGVSQGYVNRPAETAERFVPDPDSPEKGDKFYRTGDRVRFVPDGSVEFLGRVDHQIKVRGYRVEPAEIELAICKQAAIRQAVVVVREDTPGDQRLVAYIVPAKTPAPSASELREKLLAVLPEHMVPSIFVPLDELPLTPNGKIDRRALPAPDEGRRLEQSFVAPRNPVEERISGIWATVLRIPRVGVLDDFFTLGGHSLLATQVIDRVYGAFHMRPSPRAVAELFEAPTVAGMADRILVQIEALSDEEAATVLALLEEGQGVAPGGDG